MKPAQTSIQSISSSTSKVEQFFVEIILGRQSAGCKHFGICKIERIFGHGLSETANSSVKKLFALVSYKEDTYFKLSFERSSICNKIFKKYFESGLFKMEECYTTSAQLMSQQVQLNAGRYPIRVSNTLCTIRFSV